MQHTEHALQHDCTAVDRAQWLYQQTRCIYTQLTQLTSVFNKVSTINVTLLHYDHCSYL